MVFLIEACGHVREIFVQITTYQRLTHFLTCFSCCTGQFCLGSLQAYIEFFITNWFLFYYTGILACLDGYMNIAMEQTEEHVNGQLKNKYGDPW